MKLHCSLELPVSVEQAYADFMNSLRHDLRPIKGITTSVTKMVGDYAPGTVLASTWTGRKTVTYLSEIVENSPPNKFSTRVLDHQILGINQMTFTEQNGKTSFKSLETFELGANWASLRLVFFSTRIIRTKQYFITNEFGHYFPNSSMKAKYYCRIWGLPHHFITIPLWLSLFFTISALYEWLRPA